MLARSLRRRISSSSTIHQRATPSTRIRMVHHTIVALETVHMPMPDFTLPPPHTHTLITHQRTTVEQLPARIHDATILISILVPLDAHTLSAEVTPRLGLVAIMGSGTDAVDLAACKRRGITVTNCPHANVHTVAEHALGLYFAVRRRTVLMHELVVGAVGDGREWLARSTLTPHMRVQGRAPLNCADEVVGIVGGGAVGQRIKHVVEQLGMQTLMAGRKGADDEAATAADRTPFAQVLEQATVLVLSLPRVPSTLNLLSTAEFRRMRPDAVVVNVSRGGIVDEAALLAALRDGTIAGAATDVLAQEPSTGGKGAMSVLCGEEARGLNLVISPHVAWFGEATMANYARLLKENVEGWSVGRPQNVVV